MKYPETDEFDDLCVVKALATVRRRDLEDALKQAAEDEKVAENMRDYWTMKADGQAQMG